MTKEDLIKATPKELAKNMAKTKQYQEAKLEELQYNRKYRLSKTLNIILHPLTLLALLAIALYCFGYYYDWNLKTLIEKTVTVGLSSLFTSLIKDSIKRPKKQERDG